MPIHQGSHVLLDGVFILLYWSLGRVLGKPIWTYGEWGPRPACLVVYRACSDPFVSSALSG